MTATKKTKKLVKPEETVTILAKALEGRASLEHYSDPNKGTIVAFRGVKEIFWVNYYDLKELVEEFEQVIKIKVKK